MICIEQPDWSTSAVPSISAPCMLPTTAKYKDQNAGFLNQQGVIFRPPKPPTVAVSPTTSTKVEPDKSASATLRFGTSVFGLGVGLDVPQVPTRCFYTKIFHPDDDKSHGRRLRGDTTWKSAARWLSFFLGSYHWILNFWGVKSKPKSRCRWSRHFWWSLLPAQRDSAIETTSTWTWTDSRKPVTSVIKKLDLRCFYHHGSLLWLAGLC